MSKPSQTASARTAVKSSSRPGRRAMPKSKSSKASQPNKAEISAMLISAQKKLMDAENALVASEKKSAVLNESLRRLEAETAEFQDAHYDREVDVRLLSNKFDESQVRSETAVTELRHLTRLLASAESQIQELTRVEDERNTGIAERDAVIAERDAVTAERDAVIAERDGVAAERDAAIAERDGVVEQRGSVILERDKALTEVKLLRASLSKAQDENSKLIPLEQRAVDSEQALERRTREVADLTLLLEETEDLYVSQKLLLENSLMTGQTVAMALILPPDTERLDSERLNRAAVELVAKGIIDPDWYLQNNDDVAENNLDPALHFLEYGYPEGRAPRASSDTILEKEPFNEN